METASVRDRWLDEEWSARSRMVDVGVVSSEMLTSCGGLKFWERILQGVIAMPPISLTLGFIPISVAPGEAVFQGTPLVEHYNPMGSVHGGYFFSLLDSAAACAVHTTLPARVRFTTLEMKINFIHALTSRTGPVRALGKVIHRGRSTSIAEGRIEDPDGKVYAHCTTTCLLLPEQNGVAKLSD